jgi:hypothetical protein
MALYLFIGMALLGTFIQYTRPGVDKNYFLGLCWPAVALIGVPALATYVHDLIFDHHDHGEPIDKYDTFFFIATWITIILMVVTTDGTYELTTVDIVAAILGLIGAAAAFLTAAHYRD